MRSPTLEIAVMHKPQQGLLMALIVTVEEYARMPVIGRLCRAVIANPCAVSSCNGTANLRTRSPT